jgi:hypothetical protein
MLIPSSPRVRCKTSCAAKQAALQYRVRENREGFKKLFSRLRVIKMRLVFEVFAML